MSMRNDSAKREILLALISSPLPLTKLQLCETTGRLASEVVEAVADLEKDFLILLDGSDRFVPAASVLRTAAVMARGLNPLDRHIAEAIAIRDGELKPKGNHQ